MNVTLIFPDQLFKFNPSVSKTRKIFMFEKFDTNNIKPHKQKILLHLASMDNYKNYIKKLGHTVEIIEYSKIIEKDFYESFILKYKINSIHLCKPNNKLIEKKLSELALKLKFKIFWYDSPNFLLNENELNDYFNKNKNLRMSSFYIYQRKKFNVLVSNNKPIGGQWSFDKLNRKALPQNHIPPEIRKIYYNNDIKKFTKIIKKKFNHNLGSINSFNYPTSFEEAENSFEDFLQSRFYLFGDYEDAISTNHNFLYHSILTPYLNMGLITPKEILDKTLYFIKHNKIPINSTEGFLRQIIGWREFIRLVYFFHGEEEKKLNFWNFNKIIPKSFYNGSTNILPLDHSINNVIKNGYSHHIERLMIIGNFMVLCRFSPFQVYKWFMEMYVDAYEWVMIPNVFGMSQFSDGGIFSTKPYISGSNYILKMSNFKKDKWSKIWDSLYWNFINDKRDFFYKNPRMKMMVSLYDKKDEKTKKEYINYSTEFFKNLK